MSVKEASNSTAVGTAWSPYVNGTQQRDRSISVRGDTVPACVWKPSSDINFVLHQFSVQAPEYVEVGKSTFIVLPKRPVDGGLNTGEVTWLAPLRDQPQASENPESYHAVRLGSVRLSPPDQEGLTVFFPVKNTGSTVYIRGSRSNATVLDRKIARVSKSLRYRPGWPFTRSGTGSQRPSASSKSQKGARTLPSGSRSGVFVFPPSIPSIKKKDDTCATSGQDEQTQPDHSTKSWV